MSHCNNNETHPDMIQYLFHLRHLQNIHLRKNRYPYYDKRGKVISGVRNGDCYENANAASRNVCRRKPKKNNNQMDISRSQLNKSNDYIKQVEFCRKLEENKLMKHNDNNKDYCFEDQNIIKRNKGRNLSSIPQRTSQYTKNTITSTITIIPTTTSAKIKAVSKEFTVSKLKPFKFKN